MKSVKVNALGYDNQFPDPTMENQMFRLFTCAMLLTVAVVGDALALAPDSIGGIVGVPSPEIGGGMVGTMVAAGVVYLINRRRSRS